MTAQHEIKQAMAADNEGDRARHEYRALISDLVRAQVVCPVSGKPLGERTAVLLRARRDRDGAYSTFQVVAPEGEDDARLRITDADCTVAIVVHAANLYDKGERHYHPDTYEQIHDRRPDGTCPGCDDGADQPDPFDDLEREDLDRDEGEGDDEDPIVEAQARHERGQIDQP